MICTQRDSVREISSCHRWFMFLIAIVESMIWSGTIYGWPQLVYMLKLNGIYSQLCNENPVFNTSSVNLGDGNATQASSEQYVSCPDQDKQYALIYTVACVLYSSPGMLIGYALHYLGLTVTRVAAGSMITTGFLLLAVTSTEFPDTLWGAAILIAVGGNTVRMAGLQFGNLFPERRATATAIISGIYSPSAAVFIFFKYAHDYELTWITSCLMFAAISGLILVFTPFMPRHHVPFDDQVTYEDEICSGKNEMPDSPINNNTLTVPMEKPLLITPEQHWSNHGGRKYSNISSNNSRNSILSKAARSFRRGSSYLGSNRKHLFAGISHDPHLQVPFKPEFIATPTREFISPISGADFTLSIDNIDYHEVPPFTNSLLSISSVLACYWMFINTISPIIFAAFYNTWIEKIALDAEEVGKYVWLYGYANIACMLFTLVPGLMIHASTICFVGRNTGFDAQISELQSLIIPLTFVCLISTVQFGCLLFENPIAIYISLAALAMCRPLTFGVGYPFLRLRFPGQHFDRMAGTHGTLKSILTLLQYPYFIIAQSYYQECVWFAVGLLLLGLLHPVHLFSRQYLSRVLLTQKAHPIPHPIIRNIKDEDIAQSYEPRN